MNGMDSARVCAESPLHGGNAAVLTGRVDELNRIFAMIRRWDGPAGVVVAGPAGVGKTRLVREVMAVAGQRGALVRCAVGTDSARALPLGAFATTVRLADPEPTTLVRQVSEALLAGAGPAGVVVAVDDAHLLDDLSAALVHQLVLTRAASVVLTVRAGETAPDAVTALWKDGHLPRLDLQPLSRAETAAFVETRLGGPVDDVAVRRLWSITRGNASYLCHLVDDELGSGRLREVAGVWRWSGEPSLSPGLVELVTARIGELPAGQRGVVEVLAFGEPLEVSLLAELTDVRAMEQAEAKGLIEVSAHGWRWQARLADPLVGAVQRIRTGALYARRLRGRIAGALGATGGRRADDTLRRAILGLDSDSRPDAALLTDAAGRATELGDLALATRLARAAVAAGGGFDARLLLDNALGWSGRGGQASAEWVALHALAETEAQRAQLAMSRATRLAWDGRPAEAEAVLVAAATGITDEAAVLELAGMRSLLDAHLGRTVQAARTGAEVLAHPRRSSSATQWASMGVALAHGGLGRPDGTRADTAPAGTGMHQQALVVAYTVRGLLLGGLLDEADEVVRRYYERCPEHLSRPLDVFGSLMSAHVAIGRGRVGTAARWYRQAVAALDGADPNGWSFTALVGLTTALGMSGAAPSARQNLAAMTAARHATYVYLAPNTLLAQAWVIAAEGGVTEAVALTRQAAQVAASQDQPAVEVLTLHTAVCFGDRTVAERLAELATLVEGPRAKAAAIHAAALAADDGPALHAVSKELERLGMMLPAADAAAQAAAAHSRHNRRGSAQTATRRAHRLAQACEGARTPALAALAAPPEITRREREIIALAAHGLSNNDIARRLVVSVRTVENHLYRASTKLGTSNRTELAALLQEY
jgi:DNA-binding NarL/FixJ family response regulator